MRKTNYISGFVYGLDFCRALNERGWLWKLLFRLSVGKYAYSEFAGMWNEMVYQGFAPYFSYGLENMDYHNEKHLQLNKK